MSYTSEIEEINKKFLKIITYQSDNGTAGYLLSDKQIEKVANLFDEIWDIAKSNQR